MKSVVALLMLFPLPMFVGCGGPSDPVKNLEWHTNKLIKQQTDEIRQAEDTEGVDQVLRLADRDAYDRVRQAQQDARIKMNEADKEATIKCNLADEDASHEMEKAIHDAHDKMKKEEQAAMEKARALYHDENGLMTTEGGDAWEKMCRVPIYGVFNKAQAAYKAAYDEAVKRNREEYDRACKENREACEKTCYESGPDAWLRKKQTWYKVRCAIENVHKYNVRKTDSLTTPAVARVTLSCQVSCSNLFTTKDAAANAKVGESRSDDFTVVFGYRDNKWEVLPESLGLSNLHLPEGSSLFGLLDRTMRD
jgi:hypothetical protein